MDGQRFTMHEREEEGGGGSKRKIGRSGDFKKPARGFLVASAYCPEFRDEGRHSRGARRRTLSRIILATRGKISRGWMATTTTAGSS